MCNRLHEIIEILSHFLEIPCKTNSILIMKKIILVTTLFLAVWALQAQDYYTQFPEGFGAATTGGGNVAPVTVTTYTDLKTQLQSAGSKVILVSGTIDCSLGQISEVVVNKTIIGLPGARLVNNTLTQSGSGILNLKNGSNNVIIRNLIFEGPGAYDIDGRDNLKADGCTNLWVDHCEFQDGIDGNFDNKGNTDNVTISWCKFTYLKPAISGGSGGSNDHRFSNLVGSSSSNAPADGHYSITFQNCYWGNGCKERMPRARNAELHILNCYYSTDVSSSTAIGLGGGTNNLTCYVENTNFESVGLVYKSYVSSDGGVVSLVFDNCINGMSNVGPALTAPSYSYTVIPVEDVETYIADASCGAGATLQVTSAGVISSPCDNLSVDEVGISPIKIYPTLVHDTLNIQTQSQLSDKVEVSIYASNGQKLITQSYQSSGNETVSLNLNQLSQGLYFCMVQIGELVETVRLVKK